MTNTMTTTCYVHPTRETSLRCKKCERYICTSCAIHTPTGYMCKECVRERQKVFDTAMWYDYLIGFGVTFVLSIIASILAALASTFLGFLYGSVAAFFIAGAAGALIADIALRAVNKRRSKSLFISCAAGVASGALLLLAVLFFTNLLSGLFGILIYIVVATPTVYTRISGIQLTR
jgi:hypothetical protein